MRVTLTILLIAFFVSVAGQIRDPLRHYSFDNTLVDSSGNGATLKMYGNPTFSSTVKASGSHSISLDGTGDMLTIPTTNLTNEFFISFWVRTNTDIAAYRYMFSKAGANAFQFQTEATNMVYVSSYISSFNNTTKLAIWDPSNWAFFLVYFYDTGSNTRVRIWKNGSRQPLADSLIATGIDVNDSIYIGANLNRGGLWIGNIDEMRIYSGFAPTQAQIDSLYQKTYIGTPGSAPEYNPIVGRHVRFFANGIEKKDKGRNGTFQYWMSKRQSPISTLFGLNRTLQATDYDGVCPEGATRQTDCDCAVNNFSRAPLRKVLSVTDFANVKYIDFTDAGSLATGTETEPYNSWDDWTWTDNTAYRFKCGTVSTTTSRQVINADNVLLGSYGTGVRPIIRSISTADHAIVLDGNGNMYTVRDLQFEAPNAYDGIMATTNRVSICGLNLGNSITTSDFDVDIYNCISYYTPFGLRSSYPQNSIRVIGCTFYKTATEGAYPLGRYIEFAFTSIYDINNMADVYPEIHKDPGDNLGSVGDGIQSSYWNQMFIHNSTVDHGDQPNKATIMLEPSTTGWEHERCIIEYNVLVGPKTGSTGVQTINHASSNVGINLIGNILFESPLNNNATISVWNGNIGVDTMMNNVFAGYATAIYQSQSDNAIIDNNIFHDITTAVSASGARAILSFRNNITYGATNVFYNISATYNSNNYNSNPNFINPTINPNSYDFRLQSGSSAIDYGINTSYNLRDILYITRPQGINIDAGPYESTNSQ